MIIIINIIKENKKVSWIRKEIHIVEEKEVENNKVKHFLKIIIWNNNNKIKKIYKDK